MLLAFYISAYHGINAGLITSALSCICVRRRIAALLSFGGLAGSTSNCIIFALFSLIDLYGGRKSLAFLYNLIYTISRMAERYQWDEVKRRSNPKKHGFDFLHAHRVLDNP